MVIIMMFLQDNGILFPIIFFAKFKTINFIAFFINTLPFQLSFIQPDFCLF